MISTPAVPAFAAVDLGASSGRVIRAEITGTSDRPSIEMRQVARFPNEARYDSTGVLRWDLEGLYEQILSGLRAAGNDGPLLGIGIDSWAVDYGLIDDDGALLAPPVAYRDARGGQAVSEVHALADPGELYAITGIAHQPFNTIFQLAAERRTGLLAAPTSSSDPLPARALLLPDLLGYRLTGVQASETTNASTTGLLDQDGPAWSADLLGRLGLPADLFPPLVEPGHVLGPLTEQAQEATGLGPVPVIAVGSHDTASAVAGIPATSPDFAYISCGTWSLVGVEVGDPVLTEDAREANFTNELGLDGRVRFLRNVMGLWLLQESQRIWAEAGEDADLARLLDAAARAEPLRTLIDADDPAFLPPGDMPERIRTHAVERGEPDPVSPAQIIRTVLDSLALAYRRSVRAAVELTSRPVRRVHLVGGGSQNALLCQLAADAIGLPVVAGPAESTALGNVVAQARAVGALEGTLEDLRSVIAASVSSTTYTPAPGSAERWGLAEQRLVPSITRP